MNWKLLIVSLCITALGVSAVSAQTCDATASTLAALAAGCATIARGDLCRDGATTSVGAANSLTVDTAALARLQANYPDVDPAQFVAVAFIGALSLQTDTPQSTEPLPPRVPIQITVTGTNANVRTRPSGAIITKLKFGTLLNATGISSSGDWLRVELPDQPTQPAWISSSLIQSDYDLNLLTPASASDPVPQYPEYTPMQAFSFTTASPCAGVVVQSDDNPAQLNVNGVALQLNNATAYLQNTGDALHVNVLTGDVQVQAQDTAVTGIPGTVVRITLDANGQPSAVPDAPVAYDDTVLAPLAGDYLPVPVVVTPAASSDAIQSALSTPLNGIWNTVYPLSANSKEGGDCANFTSKGAVTWIISVAQDGSTFTIEDPSQKFMTAVRSVHNIYMLQDIPIQVLSPTEMTATYDNDPEAACTNIITITSQWVGPAH